MRAPQLAGLPTTAMVDTLPAHVFDLVLERAVAAGVHVAWVAWVARVSSDWHMAVQRLAPVCKITPSNAVRTIRGLHDAVAEAGRVKPLQLQVSGRGLLDKLVAARKDGDDGADVYRLITQLTLTSDAIDAGGGGGICSCQRSPP